MPRFIGLMSGTSLDSIDAALVDIEATGTPQLLATHAEPIDDGLHHRLLALCHAERVAFSELAAAEDGFCRLQARAVTTLLTTSAISPSDIVAIGSHGQTIEHAPDGHSGGPRYTLQLDNPSLLAELTGCRVVADFRRRDLAAGGQAAPLAPAFHEALFRAPDEWRLALNLGGFANLTLLPPAGDPRGPLGFDTGPANALLDAWHARHRHARFDSNGTWAASGEVDAELLGRLLKEPFFHRPPPRSTGRELFHLEWLQHHLSGREAPQDVQATLSELTAASVAMGIEMAREMLSAPPATMLVPCGGGAHNGDLLARLARRLPETPLVASADWGWPADWLEAGAFAWLAWQRMAERPGNLPSVTGAAGTRVLGGVYAP
ncbi:anhydro-N-acetylmuramic acid kinase [Halomonas urumqiensis]|uniref:Anhydro-N-acetylmuramic acid kinase n=1 Tax=Halomonas urumqiensis TaxID=1684789 RepID=A0A2N7UL75_9GAMM|nr:anhydro-N-acetylmuramic acid kinase [Halomonas urumqiensis]PMR81168.1 anhydro-N-acetylmuramic acid kinase [Halomonas urumqiensis]PTB02460.1 anhydro-N-acetylmuramic acid kinase [Halomonas urumqiensis]GHE20927.1 anhydro-N-acetylmuramic acid kinase [Halomonas urumqiensis]